MLTTFDPLSDALARLKPLSYVSRGLSSGGNWSVQFGGSAGVKCYTVTSGECLLAVDGVTDVAHLRSGDCVLLPSGRPFRFCSDVTMESGDANSIVSAVPLGEFASHNGGGDFSLVGSCLVMAEQHAPMLLNILPPVMHVTGDAERVALRWSLEQMMHELRQPQPGGVIVSQHLAHLMLVQGLRAHLERTGGGVGWFVALANNEVGASIRAMHKDPARRWTLHDLASKAAMSRSAFAAKFKQMVGAPPLEYLARWRMLLAADKMATSDDPVSVIAPALGYDSESAFSTAFKRIMGSSPRAYRQAETMQAK